MFANSARWSWRSRAASIRASSPRSATPTTPTPPTTSGAPRTPPPRPGYVANGRDRCYFCKTELYDTLAARYPAATLLSGANQDDQGDWRPAPRAAADHAVVPPLIGVSKEQARPLAPELQLPSANKPA